MAEKEYARVVWTADDILGMYENEGGGRPGTPTQAQAETWLHNNAKHIRDAMVERGWDAIDTLLDLDDPLAGSDE